ncbi:MAG: hypothetical protein RMJ19_11245 [Gemmatales bacterium]|nr:hypothetical protein [Gemmatales bacterium]MCS7161036.1 hypothetical protein [Gemmatales bacterium]MDW8176239.1 hypothetical protein [Gemmatales bacterium]MDW8222119.1 hypothetical protein [Gemmatales bacterium]
MSKLADFIVFLCLLLGMSGLAAGGVLYFRDQDAPGVRIEPETIDIGQVAPRKKVEVDVYITNPTFHTVRLVGIGHC